MRNSALVSERSVSVDRSRECLPSPLRLCRIGVGHAPDDEREAAVAVLFDAGPSVGLVLAALLEQRRNAFGAEVDFDEPGVHEVAV